MHRGKTPELSHFPYNPITFCPSIQYQVPVTNISNPEHIVRAGMMGVGAISVPYNLIKMLGSHINTEQVKLKVVFCCKLLQREW